MKKLSVILILLLTMLFGTVVEARSYGSRSRSSRSYSSRSYGSRSSSSKRSYNSKPKHIYKKSGTYTNKQVQKTYKVKPKSNRNLSKQDKNIQTKISQQKSKQAKQKYKTYNNKIKNNTQSKKQNNKYAPRKNSKLNKKRRTYSKRENRYRRQHHIPVYYHTTRTSYGSMDALWLYIMLDNINDAQYYNYYYAHRNSPEMRQWRREMDMLALNNAQLRNQLMVMDNQANLLQEQNYIANTNVFPNTYFKTNTSSNFFLIFLCIIMIIFAGYVIGMLLL